jgi:hypothetical protein
VLRSDLAPLCGHLLLCCRQKRERDRLDIVVDDLARVRDDINTLKKGRCDVEGTAHPSDTPP